MITEPLGKISDSYAMDAKAWPIFFFVLRRQRQHEIANRVVDGFGLLVVGAVPRIDAHAGARGLEPLELVGGGRYDPRIGFSPAEKNGALGLFQQIVVVDVCRSVAVPLDDWEVSQESRDESAQARTHSDAHDELSSFLSAHYY